MLDVSTTGTCSHYVYITKGGNMLWTIFVILLVLWALGMLTGATSGLIHIFLVVAVIVLIVRLVQGRNV